MYRSTRGKKTCRFVGLPSPFPPFNGTLPSIKDVLKCILYHKSSQSLPNLNSVFNIVADQVLSIYQRARIETIAKKSLTDKIQRYYKKYQNLKKSTKTTKTTIKYQEEIKKLFEATNCQCKGDLCQCTSKLSNENLKLLKDQRDQKQLLVNLKSCDFNIKVKKTKGESIGKHILTDDDVAGLPNDPYNDQPNSLLETISKPNKDLIPTVCEIADRFNLTDIVTAAIINGILIDYGLINGADKKSHYRPDQLRQLRIKRRESLVNSQEPKRSSGTKHYV